MKKVTLHILNSYDRRSVPLDDEITIGRTDAATLRLEDSGLSRVNTAIFRDGDAVLIADENSTNGTFINGRRISGPPEELRDGDEIKIGTDTRIRVEIGDGATVRQTSAPVDSSPQAKPRQTKPVAKTATKTVAVSQPQEESGGLPVGLIVGALIVFFIVAGVLVGVLVVALTSGGGKPVSANGEKSTPIISTTSRIPVRVIDPLGGEDDDDLDDIIAKLDEVSENELDANSVSDIKVDASDTEDKDLAVSASLLADRKAKALEPRSGETGIRPAGLNVPKELFGDGVIKQKAKLTEMKTVGNYHQPLDFAELAQKRLQKELIEMPMATQSFYLDVGGSASDGPFQQFAWAGGDSDIPAGSPKYQTLAQLAANFAGQKYDLNNAADRKQMRIRLLRMFNPKAKPILEEIAGAYFQKFGRPLRVTSLTRSIDYQISLNGTNANSFKVKGEGSLPPHTSGCAFDLARKHMTAEEQNFVMQKLAQMEDQGRLDALIEYGANACFHIFIYFDGHAPRM